ncbi:MAG: LysR family transcriptional regulator [Lachnospiraceae bacterium]|nr:LysR family transcriptional regulator [Lachnospiraceae bacterium]
MLDLNELEQLITFADMGTLSMAAEKLHISQPTITRTMQHLEDAFGVSLFVRGKNKIILNDTGMKAVEQAKQLLLTADNALKTVRAFDKNLHTITIISCAPAPLWYVLPALSSASSGGSSAAACASILIGSSVFDRSRWIYTLPSSVSPTSARRTSISVSYTSKKRPGSCRSPARYAAHSPLRRSLHTL